MKVTRSSYPLEISRRRLERLLAIQPTPDFGPGLSVADFESRINEVAALETDYNRMRSEVDAKLSALKLKERELLDYRERMLTAVAAKFGKNSEEYVAAGGVRKSERKRPRLAQTPSVQQMSN